MRGGGRSRTGRGGRSFAVSSSLLKSEATPERVAELAALIKGVVRRMGGAA